jgi:NAD(P)-dependent dehydrogenase (short-subunit alcohol dehydrogenase family)
MARLALVTGTSSGIGRACAVHLAQQGFEVLAGVRDEADAPPGLEAVKLDVTNAADIAAVAQRAGSHLHALVNNAGIAVNGPVEVLPIDEWRRQFEINVFGQVALTQALLPALLAAHGRIVNVSSISGLFAIPVTGPYAASKYAIEALSDVLRREVGPHGIHVACVEPGAIATRVWDKSRTQGERLVAEMPADAYRRYEPIINALRREATKGERDGLPPEAVAEAVGHAVTASRPRTRYIVGRDARVRALLARVLPDRALDALVRRALT